ncbi:MULTISPECIES: zinc ribbon domain-containing protein [unclassified Streptomyces]|uniref:zinc ribbon domain-containing protein n=1 Tax=unclassified Streptomyces TaxID=2593676 RepID=UPI002253BC80|nr:MULTISPECIES: zinc ribbon domain-containing protein [unclassified Streptomyces]MCX5143508.1 zinc ribbon domain-containing protein [Streptomyces sp. NBC_00338]WRZ70056.1 zinc ribbon domain-containing protein [Streptomyces sp. NBC_01257]WSU63918.1 zinc ribbon domain-containing protein [Streptomyces sp. NBC_01104]
MTGIDVEPTAREAAEQHRTEGLTYQVCRWCGTTSFRKLLCPVCASSDLESEHSDGHGVVVRSSVVNRYSRIMRNESLVRFPEGFVYRCRIVGAAPHLVSVGDRVRPVDGMTSEAGEVVLELCDPPGMADWYRG